MKLRLFILITLFLSTASTFGQIAADSIHSKIALEGNPEVFALRLEEDINLDDVKQRQDWKPYDSTYITTNSHDIWLKFELKNSSKDTVFNYLYSEDHYQTIYLQNNSELKILKNGVYIPLNERSNKLESFFTKIEVPPLQSVEVYIRLRIHSRSFPVSYPEIYSEKGYWNLSRQIRQAESKSIGFIYFYIISLITLITFAVVFWIRLRKKLYLYYLGYLFFQLIYGFLVLRNTVAPIGNFFRYFPETAYNLFEPIQFIFIAFYIFFILHLLKMEKYDNLLAKVTFYLGVFCIIYAGLRFLLSYFFYDPKLIGIIFSGIRLIILPLNLILIIWIIYKVKHPLLKYFIVGQSLFFAGSVLASYLGSTNTHLVPGHFFNFKEAPNVIFQIGLLAEVYCFSFALGQNIFLLQKDKNIANEALIEQLKKNRLLQEEMNRKLDSKVDEKTTELIELYTQLEQQKEKEIKADFTQKLKTMKMMALRSQMNPHFLFNSLNAIKHLMMTARNDDAIVYLDDFSTLLRSILQNSSRETITVEEELEILELYLSLEKNRIGESFDYSINVTSREALSQFNAPPLFLQPFAENAIWHGLYPSNKKEKKLKITFDTSESLKIIIEDNGVGRQASRMKEKLHKSMGMKITKERLSLFNHLNNPTIHLVFTDLLEGETSLGTRVTLTYTN